MAKVVKVLVAHPDPEQRVKIGMFLTRQGYNWYSAISAMGELEDLRELRKKLPLFGIPVLLTGADMSVDSMKVCPGKDGRQISETVKGLAPEIKVVVLFKEQRPDYGHAQVSYSEGLSAVGNAIAGLV